MTIATAIYGTTLLRIQIIRRFGLCGGKHLYHGGAGDWRVVLKVIPDANKPISNLSISLSATSRLSSVVYHPITIDLLFGFLYLFWHFQK